MKKERIEVNVSGMPEQKIQESLEGFKKHEVRNLNNEEQQLPTNGAQQINSLAEGVASGTSPTISIGASDVINATSEDVKNYCVHRANPTVRNSDNEGLGAIRLQRLTIGYVEEVNGIGAEEIPDFLPTRHELLGLVKYWAKIGIDLEYFWFCFQQNGSSDMRRRSYAWRRIDRIADVLGEDVVNQAIDEACAEYGKDQDQRTWNVFLGGSPEERKALQQEIAREISGEPDSDDRGENMA